LGKIIYLCLFLDNEDRKDRISEFSRTERRDQKLNYSSDLSPKPRGDHTITESPKPMGDKTCDTKLINSRDQSLSQSLVDKSHGLRRDKTLSDQTFICPSDHSTKPSRDKTLSDQTFICPSDHSTKDMVAETSSDLFYPADHSPSRSLIDSPTLYKQEIRKG
jgi:hypothetical protein